MAKEIVIPISVDVSGVNDSLNEFQNQIKGVSNSLTPISESVNDLSQSVNNLGNEINETENSSANFGNNLKKGANTSVDAFRQLQIRAREVRSELAGLEIGSQEYNYTLQRYGEIQGHVNDIQRDARAAAQNYEQQINNLIRVTGSLTAGFSAFNALQTLTGSNNELLNQSFVKLQAGIALVQGVKGLAGLQNTIPALLIGIRTLIGSLGALRTALITTGIGAAVVAVGALIAAIDKLNGVVKENKKDISDLNTSYETFNRQINTLISDQEHYISLLQAEGASQERVLQIQREQVNQRIADTESAIDNYYTRKRLSESEQEDLNNLLDTLNKFYDERQKLNNQADVLSVRAQTEANNRRISEYQRAALERTRITEQEIRQINAIREQLEIQDLSDYDRDIKRLTDTFNQQRKLFERNNQDITALQTQYYTDLQNLYFDYNNRINSARIDSDREFIEQQRSVNEQLLTNTSQYLSDLETELLEAKVRTRDVNDTTVLEIQEKITATRLQLAEERTQFLEEYRMQLQDLLVDETLSASQRIEIESQLQDTTNQIIESGVEYRRTLAQREKGIEDLRLQQISEYYSAISSLSRSSSQLLGETTVAGKAIAVAGATVDTYRAGASAFATVPFPANFAALAATIAAGLVNVKKIVDTKIPEVADTVTASTSTIPEISVPEIDVNDLIPDPIVRTETILDSTEEQSTRPQKVYVTETDIANALYKVNVVENESSF